MIKDNLSQIHRYENLSADFKIACDYLKENIESIKAFEGKTIDVNEDIFIKKIKAALKNREDSPWEAHKKYIDFHLILEGKEIMEYEDDKNLELSKEYNEEKDVYFLEGKGNNEILLCEGDFVIYYPGEAHKVLIKSEGVEEVKKLVVKIPY